MSTLAVLALIAGLPLTAPGGMEGPQMSFAKLEAVPFTQVKIQDRFWSPRQETNRKATVEHSLQMLDKYGNLLVMRLAAEGKREGFKGLLFTDSDLYKVLEGVSYTLATHPDERLSRRVDELIALIASAQQEDGYLNTWFQVTRPNDKFKNLRDWHELYCAGHMIEAAVAHHAATGKRNFLDIALKLADLLEKKYGPNGGEGYCGHPELELALVKLGKATGDRKWLAFARDQVETRGTAFFAEEHRTRKDRYDGTYWLDDMPIREHREIKGHAVRAAYLMSGAADVARESEDPELVKMLRRVWRNATERRVFITGGIGPSGHNEGFTVDYDLPNLTAYQETCASIAMALWGHRMALLFGEASYMDAVEKALYNGVLSGVALDGKSFFYVNPLASRGNHHRREWFECACCPPNVLRTIASVGGMAYATSADSLYVNLFIGGSVSTTIGGKKVGIDVETDYPWDGKVKITFKEPGKLKLRVRRPSWCVDDLHPDSLVDSLLNITVSRSPHNVTSERGYLVFEADWKVGDAVQLNLPMPVEQMLAHPYVKDNVGRAAVQRGPLVYCVEQVDNAAPIEEAVLPLGSTFKVAFRKDLLGGVNVIETEAVQVPTVDWERKLFQASPRPVGSKLTLVPYGFWDNRRAGRMEVWLPTTPPTSPVLGPEGRAEISVSFRSGNAQIHGINDGVEPASSGEQPKALCHFWPRKGGEEWVQYTWKTPVRIAGIKVYWFDDTGRGECRLPASWKLQARVGSAWQDVPLKEATKALDKWNEVSFPPVETTALRLVVQQQEGWATGIHEWKVVLEEE